LLVYKAFFFAEIGLTTGKRLISRRLTCPSWASTSSWFDPYKRARLKARRPSRFTRPGSVARSRSRCAPRLARLRERPFSHERGLPSQGSSPSVHLLHFDGDPVRGYRFPSAHRHPSQGRTCLLAPSSPSPVPPFLLAKKKWSSQKSRSFRRMLRRLVPPDKKDLRADPIRPSMVPHPAQWITR
jgi:hypothetical protein